MVEVASDFFHTLFHVVASDQMEECLNAVHTRVIVDMKVVLSSELIA